MDQAWQSQCCAHHCPCENEMYINRCGCICGRCCCGGPYATQFYPSFSYWQQPQWYPPMPPMPAMWQPPYIYDNHIPAEHPEEDEKHAEEEEGRFEMDPFWVERFARTEAKRKKRAQEKRAAERARLQREAKKGQREIDGMNEENSVKE